MSADKKRRIFSSILTLLFFIFGSFFYDKMPLLRWLLIAVVVEILIQLITQFFIKDKEDD